MRQKKVRIDQLKLEKAKKLLDASTDTETLDRALTLVVSEAETPPGGYGFAAASS